MTQHCKAEVATALCQGLQAPTAGLAASSAAALGHAGLRGPLPLPYGTRPPTAPAAPAAAGAGSSAAEPTPGGSSAAGGAAGETAKGPDSRPGQEQPAEATQQLVLARLGALSRHKDAKAVQRAATALGHLAAGSRAAAILEPALDSLLSLSASKDEDILFTAGEALCFAFGGEDGGFAVKPAGRSGLWSTLCASALLCQLCAPKGQDACCCSGSLLSCALLVDTVFWRID